MSYFLKFEKVCKAMEDALLNSISYKNTYDLDNYTFETFLTDTECASDVALEIANHDDSFLTFILQSENPALSAEVGTHLFNMLKGNAFIDEFYDLNELMRESAVEYYKKTLEILFDKYYPAVREDYLEDLEDHGVYEDE